MEKACYYKIQTLIALVITVAITLSSCSDNLNGEKMGGISSGGSFWVGVPEESGIYIQEYWIHSEPHYLVYNDNDESINLSFMDSGSEKNNSTEVHSGAHSKPFKKELAINSKSTAKINISEILFETWRIDDPLVEIFLDNETRVGFLFPPVKPKTETVNTKKYTLLYGLNGVDFYRYSNVGFGTDSLEVKSEEVFEISMTVTGEFYSIKFDKNQSDKILKLPYIKILSLSSTDLRIEEEDGGFHVYRDNASTDKTYNITLKLEAPKLEKKSLAYFTGSHCKRISDKDQKCKFEFKSPRGIIVTP